MSPDLSRGTINLIGGELDVDEPRLRMNKPSQSLHHCSVGYHPCHTDDLTMKLIPAIAIKNTSKNRRCNQTNLITRWGLTNRWTTTLFDDRLNLSKTQSLIWRRLLNKKELGACKSPGHNPNGFQHGTRASGPTDGDIALWQILDAHLFRRFQSTQKAFWGGTGAIGSSMKFWYQPYIKCPNPTPYVARVSILVKRF
jgi:hypothetical protein